MEHAAAVSNEGIIRGGDVVDFGNSPMFEGGVLAGFSGEANNMELNTAIDIRNENETFDLLNPEINEFGLGDFQFEEVIITNGNVSDQINTSGLELKVNTSTSTTNISFQGSNGGIISLSAENQFQGTKDNLIPTNLSGTQMLRAVGNTINTGLKKAENVSSDLKQFNIKDNRVVPSGTRVPEVFK